MAGSWGHMTNRHGAPYDGNYGAGSALENGGDYQEALEQCFGMIWWLAREVTLLRAPSWPVEPPRDAVLFEIEHARKRYKDGIRYGRGDR